MKNKRFIIEYANYKMTAIEKDKSISDAVKLEKQRKIDKAVFAYSIGIISVDDAIKSILDA